MGVVSIMHRITGVALSLAMPFSLYLIGLSLTDAAGFQQVVIIAHSPLFKFITLVFLWFLLQHLLAGIRYLFLDMDIGLDKQRAKHSAILVITASLIFTLLCGIVL